MKKMLFLLLLPCILRGNLLVHPTRVTISESRPVGRITLKHMGLSSENYRVGVAFFRMLPNGLYEEVSAPTDSERALIGKLRFSPRATLLKPKQEQVVKVMYSGLPTLPDGEYRAHIRFVPDGLASKSEAGSKTNGMNLVPRVSVAVPVIFRKGNVSSVVTLEGLKLLKEKRPRFKIEMKHEGKAFPFGDLEIAHVTKSGEKNSLGVLRNVSSYLPVRWVEVPLQVKAMPRTEGILRAEFVAPGGESRRVLSSADFNIASVVGP